MSRSEAIEMEERVPIFYQNLFNRIDSDGDHLITYRELHNFLQNSNDEQIPPTVIRKLLQQSDQNNDGKLNIFEFVDMVKNPTNRQFFGKYISTYIRFVVPPTDRQRRASVTEIDGRGLYEEQYSCCPPPIGMILMSVIEIAIFVYDAVMTNEEKTSKLLWPFLIFDPFKKKEAWRYLSYMLVHIGHLHLVVNLAVQLLVAVPLEMVHKPLRIFGIYFAGVISGSLATAVTDPTTRLAGASGGVYALLTAHIATILLNYAEMTYPLIQLGMFVLVIGTDFGTAIYNRLHDQLDESVGYVAHVAGAISGLLVGIALLRNFQWTKKETVMWWMAVAAYVVGVIVLIALNVLDISVEF